jgi:hypothetical protein
VRKMVTAGDLTKEVLESLWLEAVSCPGAAATANGTASSGAASNWGVCTPLSFRGCIELVRLCEARVSSAGHNPASSTSEDDKPREVSEHTACFIALKETQESAIRVSVMHLQCRSTHNSSQCTLCEVASLFLPINVYS